MSFPPGTGLTGRLSAVAGGQLSGFVRARRAEARRARVVALLTAGMDVPDIARELGVSLRTVQRDVSMVEPGTVAGVREIIEDAGLDADDLHITLSKMHDADLADIALNPEDPLEELKFKPLSQWPLIWRQGLASKIKVTGSGDTARVDIERTDIIRVLELAARLKAVDGLVSAADKSQADRAPIEVVIRSIGTATEVTVRETPPALPIVSSVRDTAGAGWVPRGQDRGQ